MQHDTRDKLQAFMQRERLSQGQLAKKARVSQPTISRALSKRGLRHGAARSRLFKYVGITEWVARRQPLNDAQEQVLEAFERIWDRSEDHANAVAKVIDALAGLRPSSKSHKGTK